VGLGKFGEVKYGGERAERWSRSEALQTSVTSSRQHELPRSSKHLSVGTVERLELILTIQ